ncbi:hypothetical protein KUTeg_014867 [Tegillarca granosa]|uniref:C2H2-type domain-containing protein n=1 Tax=Tegillarca granosa TaxID=220873 RepID=A0ABQ9EQQ5_TEGGR|nr:hypothetical protein KUTeg_014867 [Tegillarca granosa]
MSKSDFLSWDDDIDLEYLLGDYTDYDDCDEIENDCDDDYVLDNVHLTEKCVESPKRTKANTENCESPPHKKSKVRITDTNRTLYKCPECDKCLKTIAGFRGHVLKLHNLPNVKASDHKISGVEEPKTLKEEKTSTFSDGDSFKELFHTSYTAGLEKMKVDPMAIAFASESHLKLIENAETNREFHYLLLNRYQQIFIASTVNISLLADREKLFNEFHKMRLSSELHESCLKTFSESNCSESEIINFVQWFLLDLINELLVQQLKAEQKKSSDSHGELSDNDQRILFYICGFIIRSIKKRYLRSKSETNQLKLKFVLKLISDSATTTSFVKKYAGWFDKKNRGGLYKPCDNFYLLVRELETVMRKNVDIDNLSAKSLLVTKLKEVMLESFMVKHYTVKLFGDATGIVPSVLEDVISLFLTVRGYAIARLERNKLSKTNALQKKSLRQSLKSKSSK